MGEIHRLPEKKPDPISEEQEEREYLEAQRSAAATSAPLDNPSRKPQGSGAEPQPNAEATEETGNAEPPTGAQVPFKPHQGKPRARRQRLETDTFARIPHAKHVAVRAVRSLRRLRGCAGCVCLHGVPPVCVRTQ